MGVEEIKQLYLKLLPDLPRWVETRDLLMWEGSSVVEHPGKKGVVVWSKDDHLGAVVGEPDPAGLRRAAWDVEELLAFPENIEQVREVLPGFRAEYATLFLAPDRLPQAPPHRCRLIELFEIESMRHLPDDVLEQVTEAAEDGVPVVAAFDGALPVSFAYVASETETLWDVSIDTVDTHRRQGYAAAAVLYLIRLMKAKGKTAVWGAVASNHASDGLARRLGFIETERIWLLTR